MSLLLQLSFEFLGWWCVTNVKGAAPRMRTISGLFGSRPSIGFPNWWQRSETADITGLLFFCLFVCLWLPLLQ